jgi:PTS system N-acetylglucosamine-specific IIC component
VTGDLKRFFAGDPSAGAFMSGFFPVMMFGLPAACLAMYHTARPERRKAVGGLLLSMALTAFLTGVTEPIEFSFMFLAPALYAVHAVLTGLSMVIMNALGAKLGFGFSAGLFDYLINFSRAIRPWLLLPVGAAYFALYYVIFRTAIRLFDLKTPGREVEADSPVASGTAADPTERGAAFVSALGGAANIASVDACTTRLRLILKDSTLANAAALKRLGARGLVKPSQNAMQVVLGPTADQVATDIRAALASAGGTASLPSSLQVAKDRQQGTVSAPLDTRALILALGGEHNVLRVDVCSSRLRVSIRDPNRVDEKIAKTAGMRGVAKPNADSVHLVVGPHAADVAIALKSRLERAGSRT